MTDAQLKILQRAIETHNAKIEKYKGEQPKWLVEENELMKIITQLVGEVEQSKTDIPLDFLPKIMQKELHTRLFVGIGFFSFRFDLEFFVAADSVGMLRYSLHYHSFYSDSPIYDCEIILGSIDEFYSNDDIVNHISKQKQCDLNYIQIKNYNHLINHLKEDWQLLDKSYFIKEFLPFLKVNFPNLTETKYF